MIPWQFISFVMSLVLFISAAIVAWQESKTAFCLYLGSVFFTVLFFFCAASGVNDYGK